MKLNNYISKWILGIACSSAVFTSCTDDFLKPEPLSLYEPTVTFNTIAGLNSALAAADKGLKAYWTNTEAIDFMLPIMSDYLFSDIAVYGKTDDNLAFVDIETRFTPTDGWYDFDQNRLVMFWGETYNQIKYANTVISYIDKVEGLDEATKNEYLGRAYFHRSFRYLNLVFQFGDIPFITKLVDTPKQDYKSTKREAILKKLMIDMEFAVKHVPDQKDMTYIGMVNKAACRQLLIKIYLANGEYEKAEDQADILINESGYALMQNTFGAFSNPNPKTWNITNNVIWNLHQGLNKTIAENKEALMVMVNRYGTDSGIGVVTMRNLAPQWNAGGNTTPDNKLAVDRFSLIDGRYDANLDFNRALGRGQGLIRPTWFAEHSVWHLNGRHDDGDLRHNHKVGNWARMEDMKYNGDKNSPYYGQNLQKYYTDPVSGQMRSLCADTIRAWFNWPHYKVWSPSPADDNETNNNYRGGGYQDFYLYRLAETYLLRAEARYYQGDIPGATDDVNEIRERAQCKEYYETVDIDDIVDERARELYLEEWRFTELSRISYCLAMSGKPDNEGKTYDVEKLHEDSFWWHRICKYNNYYNKFEENGAMIRGRKYTIGRHNINWPIPQNAIDANLEGQLKQNPGYSGYDPSVEVWNTWEESVANE